MSNIGSFIAGLTVGQMILLAALILFYKQDRL
ncbi:hypothetical protein PAECIP111894_00233 [Paenibacillus pseudetheri]|uniref:Uncharacterized protein n=1 Tax=Paenibacillus pseudetheri TaxID=2897682 RepID=A0ABN8F7R1_9BACL|nr:hypothetical protein PAECIP111894_00233 [Paenibacillus pseudetheri]